MRMIITTITDIVAKKQENQKYQNISFPSMKFSREKTRHLTLVLVRSQDGQYYLFQYEDGRKANSLYIGKEIWGERNNAMYSGLFPDYSPIYRLDYNWETKEKFLNRVKHLITRNEEGIKNLTEKNKEMRRLS